MPFDDHPCHMSMSHVPSHLHPWLHKTHAIPTPSSTPRLCPSSTLMHPRAFIHSCACPHHSHTLVYTLPVPYSMACVTHAVPSMPAHACAMSCALVDTSPEPSSTSHATLTPSSTAVHAHTIPVHSSMHRPCPSPWHVSPSLYVHGCAGPCHSLCPHPCYVTLFHPSMAAHPHLYLALHAPLFMQCFPCAIHPWLCALIPPAHTLHACL